jgi:hypothetical protein
MNGICGRFKAGIARERFAIALLLCFLAVYLIYTYAGRRLIADIYEGRSMSVLNDILGGRASIPLEVYFRKADAILVSLAVFCALVILSHQVKGVVKYCLYFASCVFALLLFREASGHDFYHHLSRLADISDHLRSGDWYLFLSRNAVGGKGLPIYVYYSSWLGVIPYFIHTAGLSLFATLKVALFLLFVLSGLGMYLALRLFVGVDWAVLGGLLYGSSNFVLGNVFPVSNLGAAYGACLVPFAFYSLARWLKFMRIEDVVLAALTGAILLIAHPLTFINAVLGFALFAVISIFRGGPGPKRWSRLLPQAIFGGLLLLVDSAIYLIPALVEKKYVYLHHRGLVIFRPETFLALKDYLHFGDFRNPGFLVTAGIILSLGFMLFGGRRRREGDNIVAIGASLASILMYAFLTTRISAWVWEKADFLRGNQFPWRMIQPLTFFGVMCAVMVLENLFSRIPAARAKRWLTWFFRLAVFQGMVFLSPFINQISGENQLPTIEAKLGAYWLKESGWGLDEYFPNVRNLPRAEEGSVVGEVKVLEQEYSNRNEEFRISPVADDGFYALPKFWNTRYRIYANGEEVAQLSGPKGEIVVHLPRGSSRIAIHYTKPGYVFWSEKVSAASIIASILILGYFSVKPRIPAG